MAGSAIDGSDFIASGPNDFDNTPVSVPRFHVDELASGNVSLPDEEARHALGPRRLSVGDAVTLFDGQGAEAAGRIASRSRRGIDVTIDEIRHSPRPVPALTLAVAPPKGPRQDMLIEKCTELSVAGIVPLLCQRAVASDLQFYLTVCFLCGFGFIGCCLYGSGPGRDQFFYLFHQKEWGHYFGFGANMGADPRGYKVVRNNG